MSSAWTLLQYQNTAVDKLSLAVVLTAHLSDGCSLALSKLQRHVTKHFLIRADSRDEIKKIELFNSDGAATLFSCL